MHGKKNRRRLQPRHRAHALLLVPLVEGVAREIRVLFVFFQFNQQVVHRIMQIEKMNIRLQLQVQRLRISSREILGFQSRFRFSVKRINISPFAAGPCRLPILAQCRSISDSCAATLPILILDFAA